MRITDLIAAAILITLSLVCLVWLIPSFTAPPESALDLRPSFMPNLAMGSIFLLAGLMFYLSLKKQEIGEQPLDDEEFGGEASGFGVTELVYLATWVFASMVIMVSMKFFGYQIIASLFLISMMFYCGQRRLLILALVGVGMPVLIWQITWHTFSIQLPMIKLY